MYATPAGFEPKLKSYISVTADDEAKARATEAVIVEQIETKIRAYS